MIFKRKDGWEKDLPIVDPGKVITVPRASSLAASPSRSSAAFARRSERPRAASSLSASAFIAIAVRPSEAAISALRCAT